MGKTLNSTGRVMYIETSRTITETVIFALISTSSRKDGIGMIIASTIPSTASGTPRSDRFENRDPPKRVPVWGLRCFAEAGRAVFGGADPLGAPPSGAIWDVATIAG